MSPSQRLARHIRSNVIGYLALFVALGGTALALPGHKSVKADDLAKGAVKNKAIASGAVTAAKVRDAAITAPKLIAGAVGVSQLADDAVERKKIKTQAVTSQKLADGAVSTDKVADASLLAADFAAGQLSDGFVRSGDGAFTIQRGGRVYLTATLISTCDMMPCNDTYGFQVDGVAVPGASLTRPDQTGAQQLNLIGLTAALATGTHTVELTQVQVGAIESQLTFGGVLLQ